MKKYDDYKDPKYDKQRHFDEELTMEELKKVDWTKFKIIVPSENDKKELQDTFEIIHYFDEFDSDYITLNQLGHLYLGEEDSYSSRMIVVDKELYENIDKKYPIPTKDELNEMISFEDFKNK